MQPEFVRADGPYHGSSARGKFFPPMQLAQSSQWDLYLDYMGANYLVW